VKKNTGPFVVRNSRDFLETRLVDENKHFHERINVTVAVSKAKDLNLDLICLEEPTDDTLALCRLADFGKWKYEQDKRNKKQQKVSKRTTKELRFSPVIDEHDIEHKLKQAKSFIEDGDEVLLSMRLKGRQRAHMAEAEDKMNRIIELFGGGVKEVTRKKSKDNISVRITGDKTTKGGLKQLQ